MWETSREVLCPSYLPSRRHRNILIFFFFVKALVSTETLLPFNCFLVVVRWSLPPIVSNPCLLEWLVTCRENNSDSNCHFQWHFLHLLRNYITKIFILKCDMGHSTIKTTGIHSLMWRTNLSLIFLLHVSAWVCYNEAGHIKHKVKLLKFYKRYFN